MPLLLAMLRRNLLHSETTLELAGSPQIAIVAAPCISIFWLPFYHITFAFIRPHLSAEKHNRAPKFVGQTASVRKEVWIMDSASLLSLNGTASKPHQNARRWTDPPDQVSFKWRGLLRPPALDLPAFFAGRMELQAFWSLHKQAAQPCGLP